MNARLTKAPYWWVVRWRSGDVWHYYIHDTPQRDPVWDRGCLFLTDKLKEARPFTSRRAAIKVRKRMRAPDARVVLVWSHGTGRAKAPRP